MKIIINYDLIDKVNNANGIIDFKKDALKELKKQLIIFSAISGADLLFTGGKEVSWGFNLGFCTGFGILDLLLNASVKYKFKDEIQFAAYIDLALLSLKLEKLNIKTSAELLVDSELIQTDYHFSHENIRPIINQDKYILLPTYKEEGGIKDASILQEHQLGEKDYVLSIGSPSKSYKISYA